MNETVYVPNSKPLTEVAKNLEEKGKLTRRPTLRVKGQIDIGASLHVTAGGTQHGGIQKGDDLDGATMELDLVEQMDCYDHNPRSILNPKYQEIKECLRQDRGLAGTLLVTRRPGQKKYIPYRGQNTRFSALVELWEETQDPCYRRVTAVYKAWKSESDTLFSHITENEIRGNTCWYDKARSIINWRGMREIEEGRQYTAADVERATKEAGMTVPRPIVSLYDYAITHLSALGVWLSKDNVTAIRNHQGCLEHIANGLIKRHEFASIYTPRCSNIYSICRAELNDIPPNTNEEEANSIGLRGPILEKLLTQLTEAFAESLGLELKVVERLLAAGSSATAAELQEIATGVIPKPNPPSPPEQHANTSQNATGGSVETPPEVTSSPQSENAATNQGNSTKTENRGQVQKRSPVHGQQTQEQIAPVTDFESAAARFGDAINRICDLTYTRSWLCTDPDLGLPYVFWLDLPVELFTGERASILDLVDEEGNPLSSEAIKLRACAFRMLAYFSGQLGGVLGDTEREFAELLPEDSLWRQAVLVDSMSPESFIVRWQNQFLGAVDNHEAVCLRPNRDDFRELLINPVTGQAWAEFIDAFRVWDKHTWSAKQK